MSDSLWYVLLVVLFLTVLVFVGLVTSMAFDLYRQRRAREAVIEEKRRMELDRAARVR